MSSRRRSARVRTGEASPDVPPSSPSPSTPPRPPATRGSSRKSAVRARAALRAVPAPVPESGASLDEPTTPSGPPRGSEPLAEVSVTPRRSRRSAAASAASRLDQATAVFADLDEDTEMPPAPTGDEEDTSDLGSHSYSQPSRSRPSASRSGTKRRATGGSRNARSKRRAVAPTSQNDPEEEAPTPDHDDEDQDEADVDGQEVEQQEASKLPLDPEGDKKVSPLGSLLGHRQFRCVVLTFPERGGHEFVLTRDAARTLDFRDANYFCQRNKNLRVVRLTPEEREMLVQLDMIKPHLKNRPITAVYARDLFQRFGAKVVVDGRQVVDDYYESQALANGATSGQVAVPMSREKVRDEYRKRARAAKAQARFADANSHEGEADESGSEVQPEMGPTSQAAQLKEMYERREREKQREKQRRRLVSSSYTHLSPSGEPVTTTFGDAGADPFLRIGPGAGKNAARKAALHRDGMDERNWMLKFALTAAASARTHASARRRGLARLPVPPLDEGRGEVNAPPLSVLHPYSADETQRPEPVEAADSSADDDDDEPGPLGCYDPGTNRLHVGRETQPTWAQWTKTSSVPLVPGLEQGTYRLPSLGEVPTLPSRSWGVMSVNVQAKLPRRWETYVEPLDHQPNDVSVTEEA